MYNRRPSPSLWSSGHLVGASQGPLVLGPRARLAPRRRLARQRRLLGQGLAAPDGPARRGFRGASGHYVRRGRRTALPSLARRPVYLRRHQVGLRVVQRDVARVGSQRLRGGAGLARAARVRQRQVQGLEAPGPAGGRVPGAALAGQLAQAAAVRARLYGQSGARLHAATGTGRQAGAAHKGIVD